MAMVSNRVNPEFGSSRGSRASPVSITVRMPGNVTLDSAMFVASTTRRFPDDAGASAACCSVSESSPCNGTRSRPLNGVQRHPRLFDLASSREKYEHIAVAVFQRRLDGAPQVRRPFLAGPRRRILDANRKAASRAGDARCIEPSRNAFAIERRGHDDKPHIGPQRRLHIERQCRAQIALQMAFVEFVEQDRADAAEFRVGLDQTRENAFRHDFDPRARGYLRFEADAIADGVADVFAALGRHEFGGGARGDPARFEHQDLLAAKPFGVEQCGRHLRRLARAGRRFDDQARVRGERRRYFRQNLADGELYIFIQVENRCRVRAAAKQPVPPRGGTGSSSESYWQVSPFTCDRRFQVLEPVPVGTLLGIPVPVVA